MGHNNTHIRKQQYSPFPPGVMLYFLEKLKSSLLLIFLKNHVILRSTRCF